MNIKNNKILYFYISMAVLICGYNDTVKTAELCPHFAGNDPLYELKISIKYLLIWILNFA